MLNENTANSLTTITEMWLLATTGSEQEGGALSHQDKREHFPRKTPSDGWSVELERSS